MAGEADVLAVLRRELEARSQQQRIDVLERQMLSLRREVQALGERCDTVFSPPWKRLWWWLQGYRLWRVGRWYRKTDDLR